VTTGVAAPAWAEHVLQSGAGAVDGATFLPSTPDTVLWGYLPNADSEPVVRVEPGATVTIDTVSHEGLLEDQARDPVGWFAGFGVPAASVLHDARDIAASGIRHDFDDDGPHIVTGPVHVDGAEPGDLLRVEILTLVPRVHYGVISNRHGLGALPGEFPETVRYPDASVDRPDRYGSVCTFTTVERRHGRDMGLLPYGDGEVAAFPLAPFLGVMGVARATSEPVPSVPPGDHGGNIDIKLLGEGSTLYLPVQAPGALFYAGDPHYAQGNGEVALTALEAPLRATVRLSVVPADRATGILGRLRRPFAETDTHWIAVGLDIDLDEAMKAAVRAAVDFLAMVVGMTRAQALAYLSAAGDFEVSQVVDAVKGVHCLIRKADFQTSSGHGDERGDA
jgi:acetamidase/formamidase